MLTSQRLTCQDSLQSTTISEVFIQWKMRQLACDQSREQPCALGPYDLQSARLRQLALGPGGHHGPQAQLLHQPAPRQPDTSEQQQACRASDTSLLGSRALQGFSDCPRLW